MMTLGHQNEQPRPHSWPLWTLLGLNGVNMCGCPFIDFDLIKYTPLSFRNRQDDVDFKGPNFKRAVSYQYPHTYTSREFRLPFPQRESNLAAKLTILSAEPAQLP